MNTKLSRLHSRMKAMDVKVMPDSMLSALTGEAVAGLARIGLAFDHRTVMDQISYLDKCGAFRPTSATGMDANFTAPITSPSIPTPIQFLQTWLPGFVKVMTAARKIDEIIGISTLGSWEDEEIVQGIVEPSGVAGEYGDFTNIPVTSWNANFERRTVVRGEMGLAVGMLEEARAAAMRMNSADVKRQQCGVSLEIFRNAVGFYGWNTAGGNRTFGFLNDPSLPAATTAPSLGWAAADFQKITGDIRFAVVKLRTQSQDQVDPEKVKLTLALPTNKVDFLSVTTDFGISVRDWITQTYPKMRIVSAPELSGAGAGGEDMLYLFADSISADIDGSTDGGDTFTQLVQTKFRTLGVDKRAKSYVEDFSNATAGTLCKRPWAVVRIIGI